MTTRTNPTPAPTSPTPDPTGRTPDPTDTAPMTDGLSARLPRLRELYEDLHAHPELAFQERRTASVVTAELRALGWETTEGVGGTGVVGVLRNGEGPVVLLRADMDGLPVREATGLPYASTATGRGADGEEVPVMHACGHDMHVTCLLGAVAQLTQHQDVWRGTVLAVFQPAEEVLSGAEAMIADGFADRFPRPDVCLGQHVGPFPVGFAVTRPGAVNAASDNFRVRLFGRGGHGSAPEHAVDPVVMAAASVMRLQTVVSREVPGAQTAVLTVGAIHAGTKENVIPEEAELKINIRSTDETVRARVIAATTRILQAEAAASGAPEPPEITPVHSMGVTVNDPAATERALAGLRTALGTDQVLILPAPLTGTEDFGGASPADFAGTDLGTVQAGNLPAHVAVNHSPRYAPVPDPTIDAGVRALLAVAGQWLAR